jgi:hypothetical protein
MNFRTKFVKQKTTFFHNLLDYRLSIFELPVNFTGLFKNRSEKCHKYHHTPLPEKYSDVIRPNRIQLDPPRHVQDPPGPTKTHPDLTKSHLNIS